MNSRQTNKQTTSNLNRNKQSYKEQTQTIDPKIINKQLQPPNKHQTFTQNQTTPKCNQI